MTTCCLCFDEQKNIYNSRLPNKIMIVINKEEKINLNDKMRVKNCIDEKLRT